MELSILQIVLFGAAIAAVNIFIGRFTKRSAGTDSFFMRVFKDNKDFDSTLDRVLLAAIILFMLIAFHNDLKNVQTAGIVLALFNSLFAVYQSVITGKTVRDLQQGHTNGNGKAPPRPDH